MSRDVARARSAPLVGPTALSLYLLATGVGLLARPQDVERLYGMRNPGGDEERAAAVGVRQATFGALILGLALMRARGPLALALTIGAATPVVDGLAATRATGLNAGLRHFAAAPLALFLALDAWRSAASKARVKLQRSANEMAIKPASAIA